MESKDVQRHRIRSSQAVIGMLLAQRFIFQSSLFNVIRRVTVAEFVLSSTWSSSSTRQAITYASVCFPPQCCFRPQCMSLSNRTFTDSYTNTFSTSCVRILCMRFTNCAGGWLFFPPRRHLARRKHTKLRRCGNSEYEGTVCACDMNETNHGLTTGSLL